ncbi:MAG: cysteine desulfurase family protein [Bacilli bacterium]|nr:cysteine desulfurase family protein [Bacilli bacterium]MDD4407361.1 cysteine desulfurase family protein [Bacilli bacterium]
MIYLDYAANSPVDKKVLDIFYKYSLEYNANPNSSHDLGKKTKKQIDILTKQIAAYFNVLPEELIYTSGASESNNLAIKGICSKYKNKGKHIIISPLEHPSIIAPVNVMQENGFEVDIVPLDNDGKIDLKSLKSLIKEDTILVSICAVDGEIGLIEPVNKIAEMLKEYPNCYFHIDASQAVGRIKLDFNNIDLVSIAPHKFYGLNGFGLLIKKKNVELSPIINGGKSTTIYRSGTPVISQIAALEKAIYLTNKNYQKRLDYITKLNLSLREFFKNYKNVIINSPINAVPHILNFSIINIDADNLLKKLNKNSVYLSTKSACCSDNNTPSNAVLSLTKDNIRAASSVRISLSHLTTEKEINEFKKIFAKCYKDVI